MKHAPWVLLALCVLPGCYDNVPTSFTDTGTTMLPDGGLAANLAPWESPSLAMVPAATATDPCPEMIVLVDAPTWMGHSASVHAAGCIHAAPAMVWQAIQDPETAHDPTSTNSFSVIRPVNPSECANGNYQTQINAGPSGFTIDFRLCWRHGLISGTDMAPTLTETRWQKVWGSTAIRNLEGSLVSNPHPGSETTITEVYYQYHLDAASLGPSNTQTIHDYLNQIFSRLVMRSHGTML